MEQQQGLGSLAEAARTCLGIAGLAHTHGSAYMMQQANRIYGNTLILTNDALQDPILVREDQTLVAILLLSVFEVCFPWSYKLGSNAI